jgi:DNA-binding transcriptional MerR regulator
MILRKNSPYRLTLPYTSQFTIRSTSLTQHMEGAVVPLYKIGKLAADAGITIRTLRYYDRMNLLKPSLVSESGYRYYTMDDVLRLQHITTLKHLGFTLAEIKAVFEDAEQTTSSVDAWRQAIRLQIEAVRDEVDRLKLLDRMLHTTLYTLEIRGDVNATEVLGFIQQMAHHQKIDKDNKIRANLRKSRFQPEDPRNMAWVTLLREVREQSHASPNPEVEHRLAARLVDIGEDWFRGSDETLDKYWEWIRPEPGNEAKVLGLDSETMAFIDRIVDNYLAKVQQ